MSAVVRWLDRAAAAVLRAPTAWWVRDDGEASTVLLGLLIVAVAVGIVVVGIACGGAVR